MARETGTKLIASNRQARRNYEILETVEAGLVLRGSEVKSLRLSHVQLNEAFGRIDNGEMWLHQATIAVYENSQAHNGHEPDRRRKLLLHKDEIEHLRSKVDEQRLSLVPLSMYFKDGRVKVEMALGRGRNTYDKRHVIAKRDADRDAARAIAAARRA